MREEICRKLPGIFTALAMAVSPAVVFAGYVGTGSFEETIEVDGAAVVDVANESGAIEVTGDDVEHVSIRAKVKISKRLSSSNPARAEQIIRAVKRSPPVSVENGRIQINKINERYQRHASVSYKIVVPRDSEVNVQSVTGDVRVSGVTGGVHATSEKGKVTVADASVPGKAESQLSASAN